MTVDELAMMADGLVASAGPNWRRLRIAVSHDEFEALKARAFSEDKNFYEAIRGIPIVPCREPDKEYYLMQPKP